MQNNIEYLKKINAVFTPRSSKVNKLTYVNRGNLEKALKNALFGSLHIVIFGESGCGKSWLYKKVFDDHDINFYYSTINLSLINNSSLNQAFYSFISRYKNKIVTSSKNTENFQIKTGILNSNQKNEKEYKFILPIEFETVLQIIRKIAKKQPAFLILDNFEFLHEKKELMNEIGELLVLLDDDHFAKYDVRIIIVGLPRGIKEFYRIIKNKKTITNRLYETPEVKSLSLKQVEDLIKKGFIEQLKLFDSNTDLLSIADHIRWLTNGIPQYVQEYCLELANILNPYTYKKRNFLKKFTFFRKKKESVEKLRNNLELKTYLLKKIKRADLLWASNKLASYYTHVQSCLKESTYYSKHVELINYSDINNKVIWALGEIDRDDFSHNNICEVVEKNFFSQKKINDKHHKNKILSITSNIMKDLSKETNFREKILLANNDGRFTFESIKLKLCIRAIMDRDEDNRITYHELKSIGTDNLSIRASEKKFYPKMEL